MDEIDWDAIKKAVENILDERETADASKQKREIDIDYTFRLENSDLITETNTSKGPKDKYAVRKVFLAYYDKVNLLGIQNEEIRNIFRKINVFLRSEYQHLSISMKEDIQEIDACFSAKAYKACIILAGSVLEAFLLDWLSEIDGKDYFSEPYKVLVKDSDGKSHWEKRESLNEYINQISEIEYPNWMEPSEKAHYIRKSRNIVHAKVCLRDEININEETCREVISYLKEIIDTRIAKIIEEMGYEW